MKFDLVNINVTDLYIYVLIYLDIILIYNHVTFLLQKHLVSRENDLFNSKQALTAHALQLNEQAIRVITCARSNQYNKLAFPIVCTCIQWIKLLSFARRILKVYKNKESRNLIMIHPRNFFYGICCVNSNTFNSRCIF